MGKTGISVSRLAFGALTVGPCQANLSPEAGSAIIRRALELGVNFIDTAQLYRSYPHIAGAIGDFPDTVIASKSYAYERGMAYDAVDEARRALNRDMIDIFLLHEQEDEYTLAGHAPALEALYEMKAAGVVRAVGISTHHIAGVRAAERAGLDIVFPLLNLRGVGIADGSAEEMSAAARSAAEAGLGVYIMKPFGGGNLLSQTDACLKYALSQSYAASVAVGMQTLDEVEANVAFFETGSFPPELMPKLASKKRRLIIEEHCVGCGSCERACGQGAIKVDAASGKAKCDPERCITCGYCGAACPETCIKII